MKKYLVYKAFWLFYICIILLGCTSPRTVVTEFPTSAAKTQAYASFPTASITKTLQPVILPSTLMSPLESENALLNLLRSNGNCSGKCIAGIQPDEMTVQEAVITMSQWGMVEIGKNSLGKTFINLEQSPLYGKVGVYLSIGTWTKEFETIDTVIFRMQGLSTTYIGEDLWLENRFKWRGFSLDNLLRIYGVPSFVGYSFSTIVKEGSSLNGRTILYILEIQYSEINLRIQIAALANYDGKILFLCPITDPHNLWMEINPERSLERLQEFSPVTWKELTDTDLEVFYQIFTNEIDSAKCTTTSINKIESQQPYFR